MKFSVIVATLNAATTIRQCLDSILGQTWHDVEVIVADGGSTDRTAEIVEGFCAAQCTVLRGPDRGIYDAWNKALAVATGDWVLFLGADDALDGPRVFERVAERLEGLACSQAIVYGPVKLVDMLGHDLGMLGAPWELSRRELRRGMAIPNPGIFYHADLFQQYGAFDISYQSSGDYEFLLRVFRDVEPVYLSGLVITRMGAEGITSEMRSTRQRHLEDLRAQRTHGVVVGLLPYGYRRATIEMRATLIRVFGRDFTRALANVFRRSSGRPLLPRSPRGRR